MEKTSLLGGSGRPGSDVTKNPKFWLYLLVPAVVFNLTSIFFNFLFFSHWHWVLILTIFGLLVCFVLITSSDGTKSRMGITCMASVLLGAFLGLYCFDTYGIFVEFYKHSRSYTNVVPSEPSASKADAGTLTFTDESSIDTTKSIGYWASNGRTYCIAPIHDMAPTQTIEFWAVGVDCCGAQSEFLCDASADETAHGGIVVFDNYGYFNPSNRDYYDMAREKAQAEFDLVSGNHPMYVRWVKSENLGMLQSFYLTSAQTFIGTTTIINLFICAVFAYVFVKNPPKNDSAKSGLV